MGPWHSTVSSAFFTALAVGTHTLPCRVFPETTTDRVRITPHCVECSRRVELTFKQEATQRICGRSRRLGVLRTLQS
jgi:hypothetical protein